MACFAPFFGALCTTQSLDYLVAYLFAYQVAAATANG
jgi:hypothetical protein